MRHAPEDRPAEDRDTPEDLAFELLYERFHLLVTRICRRFLHRADLADDAAQNVWMSLLRRLRKGPILEDPLRWIVRTARDRARTLVRRGASRKRHEPELQRRCKSSEEEQPSPFDLACLGELCTSFPSVLAVLSERQRQVLTDHMAGRTVPEIAARLGIAQGAVREHLARALRRIRTILHGFV